MSMESEGGFANETERRLLDCALTLFAEKGFSGVSVREIIEAAGVTQPVLYYYSKNKEDLFRRVVLATHSEALQALSEIVSQPGSCAERLRRVVRGAFLFSVADLRVPRLMFRTYYGGEIEGVTSLVGQMTAIRFGLIAQIIREGLESGEIAGGDAESLTLVFCCLMDHHVGALMQLSEPHRRLTDPLADALVEVFLNGVGTGERRPVCMPPFAGWPQPPDGTYNGSAPAYEPAGSSPDNPSGNSSPVSTEG
jgi:TetR/AcrR family transcriptional regulator